MGQLGIGIASHLASYHALTTGSNDFLFLSCPLHSFSVLHIPLLFPFLLFLPHHFCSLLKNLKQEGYCVKQYTCYRRLGQRKILIRVTFKTQTFKSHIGHIQMTVDV